MLTEFVLSTPTPGDYFKNIYDNLRDIKERWQERYILDHKQNSTDTTLNDGHDRLTMQMISVDLYNDLKPYPLNPNTGICQIPSDAGVLFCKNVGGVPKLVWSCMKAGAITDIILR